VDVIRVAVTRGDVVEAVHLVHAAAVRDGELVAAAGDPELVAFLRSSAKPLQALPLARTRDDLDDRDLAIASASHLATSEQLEAVRALLAKAPAMEDDLECGVGADRLLHNCSGKHAGMLALCRTRGWPTENYRLLEHPVQQACLAAVAEAAEVDPGTMPVGVDGCGVPTFALPLERMAGSFARLESLEGGARVAAAMRSQPDLVRGPIAADSRLMRALPGWTAKGGAEGLICAASPDGLGVALKCVDGAYRPLERALNSFLASLGVDLPEAGPEIVRNSRGEAVGEVVLL
jgi:L-asparaginase II